jgi:signal transduction histidine kinase
VDELFDRFRRRSATRRIAGRGFGLGLTIVSTIARTHGGTVLAAARPAGGLRIEVQLPHVKEDTALEALRTV